MNKRTFSQYISDSKFQELFITGMGWNNPNGQDYFELTLEQTTYKFRFIAERSGFQVMTCQVSEIPTSSLVKKIDTRLRRQANDYICIFHLPDGSQHHLWVVPVKKVEKRDVVLLEYESAEQAGFLFEKVDALTFGLDEKTTIMDVKERVQGAFIVNSERITKNFYAGFRKEHTKFAKFISGIDDEIADIRQNRNKQWYTSVMLNRLMFCYFIQKKGFLNQNLNYLRDKLAWVKSEQGDDHFYSFYRGFLRNLFHDGLNEPHHNQEFVRKYGRIPYLNGGMFDIHDLERQYADIDIKDEAFESLFAFFDQWHWHLDDRLTATGKDINPDVLGYIFEQYINDRAQMGAYYTKEDITEYIGRNTIVPYLLDATKKADEKHFRENGALWQFLRESGDRYIFDAVKKGHDIPIPDYIEVGIDTTQPNLLDRRKRWNERTPEQWALPTEIWRETVERLQRYKDIRAKIENGEIHEVNDFITYNLDIRQFVQDFLAKTDDRLFVLHFYQALQKITILDPTCGSGAFLFAALNILEPLYETCITRMQEWQEKNSNLFKAELEELNVKYRNNIRYFIYKSIILRNLYGVDIMVEATEIAKLRLFLKMVAVVDVNPRDTHLGLEPLPDIDFNIRCGNTLVGYANEKELQEGLLYTDLFARQEFEQKVNDEMNMVAKAYEIFKQVQLGQQTNLDTYKLAKKELKERLKSLNLLLNQNLHAATNAEMNYEQWEKSHQPFHWLAEYYDIIKDNGGFDVIIGNPPYVSMSSIKYLKNSKEFTCSDLYGHVIKRALSILNNNGTQGFIVMHNLAFSRNFIYVRKALREHKGSQWYSFYSRIPSGLFSGDVRVRNCIYILSSTGNSMMTSRLHRWFTEQRDNLFTSEMLYINFDNTSCIPMLHSYGIQKIYERTKGFNLSQLIRINGKEMYYKKVGYNFLSVSAINPPAYDSNKIEIEQTGLGVLKIDKEQYEMVLLLLCGKFYLTKWLTYGDDFHLTYRDLLSFTYPFDIISMEDKKDLHRCFQKLIQQMPKTIQFKLNAGINVGTFNTSELWDITDISDAIFLKYISDNPVKVRDAIESHLSKCVISNKF